MLARRTRPTTCSRAWRRCWERARRRACHGLAPIAGGMRPAAYGPAKDPPTTAARRRCRGGPPGSDARRALGGDAGDDPMNPCRSGSSATSRRRRAGPPQRSVDRGAPRLAAAVGRCAGRRTTQAGAEHPRRRTAAARRAPGEAASGGTARATGPGQGERAPGPAAGGRPQPRSRICAISHAGSIHRSSPTADSRRRSKPRRGRPRPHDGACGRGRPVPTGDRGGRLLHLSRGAPERGKYADATSATVSLSREDGHLTVQVADDGRGFDPALVGAAAACRGWRTAWPRSTATHVEAHPVPGPASCHDPAEGRSGPRTLRPEPR